MDPKKSRVLPPFTYNVFSKTGDLSKFANCNINSLQGGVFHALVWHNMFARESDDSLSFDFELLNDFAQDMESAPETCIFFEFVGGELYGLSFDTSQAVGSLDEFKGALTGILESETNAKQREYFANDSKYRSAQTRNLEAPAVPLANEDAAGFELMDLGVGDSALAHSGQTLFLLPVLPPEKAKIFRKLDFSKEFVLDDWFGGELSRVGELKAFSLQRRFEASMAQDGAFCQFT